MAVEVLLINNSNFKISKKFILKWMDLIEKELLAKKILKNKDVSGRSITLVFLNHIKAKKINFDFRDKNYATDVLSFGSDDELSFGELIICPQVLKKQAKEHGLSFNHELGYMLIHGWLHLLGYEHEKSKAKAKKMFLIQDTVYQKLTKKLK